MDRSQIGSFYGGRGKGTRSVASYDEDSTTQAVEAARLALKTTANPGAIETLTLVTASPTYLEKTNAGIAHAALRLAPTVLANDAGGAVRSGIASLRTALKSTETTLLALTDVRGGLPNSPDEANGGDAAASFVVGSDGTDSAGPVIAEFLGAGSITHEFLDRWRTPGDAQTKQWEDRFTQTQYAKIAADGWQTALTNAGIDSDSVDTVLMTSTSPRSATNVAKALGLSAKVADDLTSSIGHSGTAHLGVQLAAALETAAPGQTIALISLVDGIDVLIVRTTDAIADFEPAHSVASQIATGNADLPYSKFLSWRGSITIDPPRRPGPVRMSASAAGRSVDWKYGFVGSVDNATGAIHMPPARVSYDGGNIDDMAPVAMSDVEGTVVTFTVDRLAYSPSPPVIFAVVDFDGGGRLPVELCDATPESVEVGSRVQMSFRRLNEADGIANYFWKARPVRSSSGETNES